MHLSGCGEHGENCADKVREALAYIERDNLLPPHIVLPKLSKNSNLTLAAVKENIARQLEQDTRLIEEDRKAIEKYQVHFLLCMIVCTGIFAPLEPGQFGGGEVL